MAAQNPHLSKVEVETRAVEAMAGLDSRELPKVKFTGDMIHVEFNGRHIRNRVKIVPHEFWAASYDRTKPIVIIDNDLPEKYRDAYALHESLEKYLTGSLGLGGIEAHEVTEDFEHRWWLTHYSEDEWDQYQREAERVHRKEWAHIEKMLPREYWKPE